MPLMPGMSMVSYPSALAVALFYRACLVAAVVIALGAFAARGWLARMARAEDDASPAVAPYRNTLALWLGALWTLDAILQAQPEMATRFIGGFLAPLLAGQPAPVADLIRVGMRLWGTSPIWFNVFAAFLQLLIGLAILLSRDGAPLRRLALAASIAWGVAVWCMGEAFGSVFSAGGPLVGSPGSVFLYMAAAALLLLPRSHWEAGGRLWRWLPVGFAAFFALTTLLEALPAAGWWTASGLATYVGGMARMPQPALVAAPLAAWAASLARHPDAWNAAIVAAGLTLLLAWLVRPRSALTLWATVAWTLLVWYFGQDFGVLGGMGTDPNTGAILLVFAVLWGERIGVFGHVAERAPLRGLLANARER